MLDALHPRRFSAQRPEAAGIGSLFVVLAVVHVWTTLVGYGYVQFTSLVPAWPESPILLGSLVTYVLGYGVPALVYVRYCGLDLPVTLPTNAGRGVLVAVATPLALVAGVAVAANWLFGTSVAALEQTYYNPTVGLPFLAQTSLLPAAFRALGAGLLFFGAVQTRLRDLTTPPVAVVFTAVVAGVFAFLPRETLSLGHVDAAMVALFALSVLVSVSIGLALGLVYRGLARDELGAAFRPAYVPILLVATLGVFGVVQTAVVDYPRSLLDALWLVVVTVAAYEYDRTASLWTPVASLFVFHAALGVTVYLEVLYGFAPAP